MNSSLLSFEGYKLQHMNSIIGILHLLAYILCSALQIVV